MGQYDLGSYDSEQLIFDSQTIVVGRPPVAADRSGSGPDGRPDSGKATFCEWHANASIGSGCYTGSSTRRSVFPWRPGRDTQVRTKVPDEMDEKQKN